jgi:hypothetical protein
MSFRDGSKLGREISRRVFWNAGKFWTLKERRFETLSQNRDALSPGARLLAGGLLFPAARLRPHRPAKDAFRQIAHRGFAELSRRTPGTFFTAITVVAKQAGDRVAAAKKVDLETVSLFLGAGFRIDAPDVLFRIGISSFFHRASL